MKKIISAYRSSKREEMYIYMNKSSNFDEIVPDNLKALFGAPEKIMDMILTAEKKLARVDIIKVFEEIADKGFFLQMPPADKKDMLQEHRMSQGLDDNA